MPRSTTLVFVAASFIAVAAQGGVLPGACCFADLDNSGFVDGADLGLLLASWGGTGAANLDEVGGVDGADLGLLLAAWGPCPAPANDACGSAELVDSSTAVIDFCTVAATDSSSISLTGCSNNAQPTIHKDIWYRWVAPTNGLLQVQTCASPDNLDTVVAVYGSIIDGLCPCPGGQFSFASLLACDDDGCGFNSATEILVQEGECYSVRVGTFLPTGGVGTLLLNHVKQGDLAKICNPLPSATFLEVAGSTAGDTAIQADLSQCAFGDLIDEWYCFTMPCTGTLTVSTCDAGTDFDTTLALYFADNPDQSVACNDDDPACGPGSVSSTASITAAGGEQILIRVSGFDGASGNFVLTVDVDCVG